MAVLLLMEAVIVAVSTELEVSQVEDVVTELSPAEVDSWKAVGLMSGPSTESLEGF